MGKQKETPISTILEIQLKHLEELKKDDTIRSIRDNTKR